MEVYFMSTEKENNRYYSKGTVLVNTLIIGFVGGVLASFLGIVAHYFHVMEFSPKFILTSWSNQAWIKGWLGFFITLLIFGILSIVVAFLYYLLLRKISNMIAYILFGIVCWVLFLLILNPMFKDLPAFAKMSATSIITSICLFALYGVFIGYSISFDYQEFMREEDGHVESEASS
jgi:hypothetical protein